MEIIKRMKEETRKDPEEVASIALAAVALIVGILYFPLLIAASFFILILNGVETLEKRYEKMIMLQRINNEMINTIMNMKRHQLIEEGKLNGKGRYR